MSKNAESPTFLTDFDSSTSVWAENTSGGFGWREEVDAGEMTLPVSVTAENPGGGFGWILETLDVAA